MSSVFTIIELRFALQQPGCPICQIHRQAAARYLRFLVLESINDLEARRHFSAGLGYCPVHTRQLAAIEMTEDGDWMGTNIMYEQLAHLVRSLLADYPFPKPKTGFFHAIFKRILPKRSFERSQPQYLRPLATCRVCQLAGMSSNYALETLLEELATSAEMASRYITSEGLCLNHLRRAFEEYALAYPDAVIFLKEEALRRLAGWEKEMQAYILKQTWDHRHEIVSPGEETAWQHALAFFTGYQPSIFSRTNLEQEVEDEC